jgi:hypothetical protein
MLSESRWIDSGGSASPSRDNFRATTKAFVAAAREQGKTLIDLHEQPDAAAKTIDAMKRGIHLIYQGKLEVDGWTGYAARSGKNPPVSHKSC